MHSAEDATIALERTFEVIRRMRMRDVPILNPALRVQAVGTQEFGDTWLSILITPWFINIMLLPGCKASADKWASLELGASVSHVLPAGRFSFIVGEEAGLGRFQMCSLFSPVLEFTGHDTAVASAEAALATLFDPQHSDGPAKEEGFMGQLSRGELPDELAGSEAQGPNAADNVRDEIVRDVTLAVEKKPSRRAILTGTLGDGATQG